MRVRKLKKYLPIFAMSLALISVGILIGWKISDSNRHKFSHTYPLIDPSVNNPNLHQEIINFEPLRQDIKKYLADLKLSHSFYFEYLPNGVNIRDGDNEVSRAASLIKTPLVMDLYKLSDQGKINLDTKVTVSPSYIDTDPQWGNPTSLKVGDTMTLREAAKTTLHNSSNTTLNVIKNQITPLLDETNDSFISLDLPYSIDSTDNTKHIMISSRSYSSVLKCLYYACFNNPKDSSEIIDYLIGSAEPNRLVEGIDPSIKVAHKVGSGTSDNQSDCGIIYYPGKPYLMCLMFFDLDGNEDTTPHFQHISKMIYDYINTSREG